MYAASTLRTGGIPVLCRKCAGHNTLADIYMRFGQRLRVVREGVGISQEKLAELAGLHRTYVSSVERGKRNISIQNIERLAKALKTTMAALMPDHTPPA